MKLFLGGFSVQNMLNGGWSQAVDGTMGVHMPCPYTLAPWPSMAALHCPRQPLGEGGLELEGQMEVVGKLGHPCCCHRPPLKAPSGLLQGIRPSTVGGL